MEIAAICTAVIPVAAIEIPIIQMLAIQVLVTQIPAIEIPAIQVPVTQIPATKILCNSGSCNANPGNKNSCNSGYGMEPRNMNRGRNDCEATRRMMETCGTQSPHPVGMAYVPSQEFGELYDAKKKDCGKERCSRL